MSRGDNLGEQSATLKKKAQYFFTNLLEVHIPFKKGYFKNGKIVDVQDDLIILDEFMKGHEEIFYEDITDIVRWKPKQHILDKLGVGR